MFRFGPCIFLEEEHNKLKWELSYLMEVDTQQLTGGPRWESKRWEERRASGAEATSEQLLKEGGFLLSSS